MSDTTDASQLPFDEEEEYEEEVHEEEPEIYLSENFISGPILSEDNTFEEDIFEFDFSFGYDCTRYFNMAVPDDHNIIFTSGNIIHFFDARTRQFTFRRSAFGGGLGHIAVKNDYPHFAVAENGINPPIIIYEWPSLEIVTVLKAGATRCFSHLNYSPNGLFLASQSGEPDFLITIFNWASSKILQRIKSNVNEVFRVMFSPDVPGQLTTCGLTHIKFWKMAETFTGLKLQGELGRFGKTEYCDILGIYPMPDEKVVSGCTWGNMLVWDEGLIKVEVCQVGRKKCHTGQIVQFYYDNGDLWTVGMDGYIRVWFYDTIDQCDPSDEDRFVQVKPLHTFCVPGAKLMSVQKLNKKRRDFHFYAQDGNGSLWLIDLDTYKEPNPPVRLFICHGGKVMEIATCPWGPYLASIGSDGKLLVYNYEKQKYLFHCNYPAKGATLIWIPLEIQPSGDQLLMGFDDGYIRVAVLKINRATEQVQCKTIQLTKPHNKPIVRTALNIKEALLVTAAEDSTIFIYKLTSQTGSYTILTPIGYIPVPSMVTYVSWHPKLDTTVLAGCLYGYFLQIQVPSIPQKYTKVTYKLKEVPIINRFTTYKSQILRDIYLEQVRLRKAEKLERKKVNIAKLKEDNPGMDIDEDLLLEDSSEEEVLEPLHIPDIPNRVLWLQVTEEGDIWLSMGGYDAGYIYEYDMKKISEIPKNFNIICDCEDIEINNFIYSDDGKYLILAMGNGSLRVVKVKPKDWRDLSDYWQLSMHDNYNSYISRMCFSYDNKYFFSAGYDGNVFSYRYKYGKPSYSSPPTPVEIQSAIGEVVDVDGYTNLSLDEALIKAQQDRLDLIANQAKRAILEKINLLRERLHKLLKRNERLLQTQVIPRPSLELDTRITEHLEDKLASNLALVKRKLEYDVQKSKIGMDKLKLRFVDDIDVFPIIVSSIRNSATVITLTQHKLSPRFYEMIVIVEQKIWEEELRNRPPAREIPPPPDIKRETVKHTRLEYFLLGLPPEVIENNLEPTLARAVFQYRIRKRQEELRQREWAEFMAKRPKEGVNDPEDEIAFEEASLSIGDFKLKTAHDYKVPFCFRETTVKKYKQLLTARQRLYDLKRNYNLKILTLREDKCSLVNYLIDLKYKLMEIHEEIDPDFRINCPELPKIDFDNFPERNLDVIVSLPPIPGSKAVVIPVVQSPKGDALEREVLLTEKPPGSLYPPRPPDKAKPAKVLKIDPQIVALCQDKDSEWEKKLETIE